MAQSDLHLLSDRHHDLIVVGGGISGATIAWDASLRGLGVALVEKDDFAHGTSAASSKLIHGGLRYLRNFEFGMVRESLRERRIWERIAPHMVAPLPFLLPTYGGGVVGKPALMAGLALYDILAWDRNFGLDADKRLPGFRTLTREAALAAEPALNPEGLTGAAIYHDCQMFSPERLVLEFILGAQAHGAVALNRTEVTGFVVEAGRVTGIEVRARDGGARATVRGAMVVNATGPWADLLLHRIKAADIAPLIRSKGIHVLTRRLTEGHAIAMQQAGGHFFVLPWRGKSLIGTTDTVYKGSPDDLKVSKKDIRDFLAVVNRGLPSARLTPKDVVHTYAGLRPLVDQETSVEATSSYNVSRQAEIFDHEDEEEVAGLLTVAGGKYTTSRHLAEQVVDLVLKKLGRRRVAARTESTPLPGGATGPFDAFVETVTARRPALSAAAVGDLCRYYGSRVDEVLSLTEGAPDLARPLAPERTTIGAQIVHAARAEMARHLDDMVFRRSGFGTLGHPGINGLERAAAIMGRELGWDAKTRKREIDHVLGHYS